MIPRMGEGGGVPRGPAMPQPVEMRSVSLESIISLMLSSAPPPYSYLSLLLLLLHQCLVEEFGSRMVA